jgi:hypothetical protein
MCATMSLQTVTTMYVPFVNSICSTYFGLHTGRKELFFDFYRNQIQVSNDEIENDHSLKLDLNLDSFPNESSHC